MQQVSSLISRFISQYLPNAYIFALLLTGLSFVFAFTFTDYKVFEIITFWGDGFFNLLKFAMQMSLILVTGSVLADTKIVNIFLGKVAKLANGQVRATVLVTLISLLFCYINWGLGLIVGAVFTLYVARNLEKLNFPLLVASAYSGFLIWHAGPSGSIPLKLTELGIPLAETIFSSFNLVILAVVSISVVVLNFIYAKSAQVESLDLEDGPVILEQSNAKNFSARLDQSLIIKYITGLFGFTYLVLHLSRSGFSLNSMIFLFLFLGILLHKNSRSFLDSFEKNIKTSSAIILQFMFYAGIMGIISSSGLGKSLSQFFIDISTKDTFLINTYLSAGILNFFVPSGGGQWAIQGPIVLAAAKSLGVDASKAAMSVAWGDAWTNMIQPFWALPILNLTGMKLNSIMGYLVGVFLLTGALITLCLWFLA